jgi:hypothetical protein
MKTTRNLARCRDRARRADLAGSRPPGPASVGVDYLCCAARSRPAQTPGPRASPTRAPPAAYVLNAQGCAPISLANSDAAYFQSQGYTPGPNLFSLIQQTMPTSTTATTSTITLPANAYIAASCMQETAGNAVTGGVDIGNATSATPMHRVGGANAGGVVA